MSLQEIARLHQPRETTLDSVFRDGEWVEVNEHSGAVCMTCQGYPPAPCETYRLATSDGEGMEVARVTISRRMTPDDVVDYVTTEDPQGEDLPLTEALGMLRLAEDTIIRERTDGEPPTI